MSRTSIAVSYKASANSAEIVDSPKPDASPQLEIDVYRSWPDSEEQVPDGTLQSAKAESKKLSPLKLVWNISEKKSGGLEACQALEEKLQLLDAALGLQDSSAVVVMVMHMKHSLRRDIFVREILFRPDAIDQYAAFLIGENSLQECWEFLQAVGRKDEATLLLLRMFLQKHDVQDRLNGLDWCVRHLPAASPPASKNQSIEVRHLHKLKQLLEIQKVLDEVDEKASRDPRNKIFTYFPRIRSPVGLSVMETLTYCFLYHYYDPVTSISSPFYLQKTFAISEKQFSWVAVDALAKLKNWNELQTLLTDKAGWLRGPRPKAAIGFENVVNVLARNGAPAEVLAYYLRLVSDLQARLDLSKKTGCHIVVIDTLNALKQFDQIKEYNAEVDAGSPEWVYLQNVMRKSRV